MSGALRAADDGGAVEPCQRCGAPAVGPCASCQTPVCGDCCVLTRGGATTFAICLPCEHRRGDSLAGAWRGLLLWIVVPVLVLAAIAVALIR